MIQYKAAKEGIEFAIILGSLIARAFYSVEAITPRSAKSDHKAIKNIFESSW